MNRGNKMQISNSDGEGIPIVFIVVLCGRTSRFSRDFVDYALIWNESVCTEMFVVAKRVRSY